MGPDTPGDPGTMAQKKEATGDHVASQTGLFEDSIPINQLHDIARRIDQGSSQTPLTGSTLQSNTTGNENQGHCDPHAEHSKGTGYQSTPRNNSADGQQLSPDMERYRRMEAFLLKHRKQWELNNEPYITAETFRNENRSSRTRDNGPWKLEWDYRSVPMFPRPNPFELVERLNELPSQDGEDKQDEFDISINYNAARNRVRKNFEWDMDRLFLIEEIAIQKQKQSEEKNADDSKEDHAAKDEESKERTGPELKLNYLRWPSFRRLHNAATNESCVIDVLTEDPVVDDDTGLVRRARVPAKTRHSNTNTMPGQAPLPERIRIHSKTLGEILADLLGSSPGDFESVADNASFVLVRPFKSLFYCSNDLRSLIAKLEEKFSTKEKPCSPVGDDTTHNDRHEEQRVPADEHTGPPPKTDFETLPGRETSAHVTSPGSPIPRPREAEDDLSDEEGDEREEGGKDKDSDNPNHSEMALQHLKVLMGFVDSEIETKRAHLLTSECRKVFFTDLWYLFRPGEEVIGRDGKQAYRVISVSSPRHQKTQPWDAWLMFNSQGTEKAKKKSPFSITCVYIDFNGSYIGPVSQTFDFKQFDGQREITSLPVYPIRLHTMKESEVSEAEWRELKPLGSEKRYRQHLVNRGAKFLDVLGVKPMYYAGPTLGVREEIESQVVIDFEMAFSADDGQDTTWQPELEILPEKRWSAEGEEEEEGDILDRMCGAECCRRDWIYDDTFVDDKERTRYINSLLPSSDRANGQPSIAVIPQLLKDLKDGSSKTGYSISDDELLIMSCRVFGFVLRQRRWAQLDISYLTELDAGRQRFHGPSNKDGAFEGGAYKTAFDNLVLEENQKPMIQALVAQHFRDKEYKAGQAAQMDIVKGKGKGLILLLHGAPGVGKTSTAEGVAELFKRPLFQITCGDLGTTAKEVEKSLDVNFTLANRWNCILLLDEADVFLAQRNKEDFLRNGLVAVFLRVLEYYAGVLFLTTNRVGDFDEAFTSRIHVSLYYPALDSDKTSRVFQINIKMIEDRFRDRDRKVVIDDIESFARAHFADNPDARWNGRQIRNACQTALALAEFEAQGNSHETILKPDAVVHLKVSHFQTVQKAYRDFAQYMTGVYGSTAETRAQEGKVRAILDPMNGRPLDNAERRRAAFGSAARAQFDIPQQPATSVAHHQAPAPAQPSIQPTYMAGGQQYINPGTTGQGYYPYQQVPVQATMYQHPYAQQPVGMPSMQQHPGATPLQTMAPIQQQQPQAPQHQHQAAQHPPQAPQYQPLPQSMVPLQPQDQQVDTGPDQSAPGAQGPPRKSPSQTQQPAYPPSAPGSTWLNPNTQDIYVAGSPAAGGGYPPQSGGGGGGGSFAQGQAPGQEQPSVWQGSPGFTSTGMRQ